LAVLAAVASVVPCYDALVDHLLSDRKTEQANESNKEYDAGQQPFTVTVRPDESEPDRWVMGLHRELPGAEVRTMKSSEDVFSYLRDLGGRPLAYAPFLEHAPERYTEEVTSTGRQELSDTFKMTVLSTRQYSVAIDDWKVTDLSCRESTAKT